MAIPRLIHQIWIQGFNTLPEIYRRTSRTWQENNQSWSYKFWDDGALQKFMRAEAPEWLPLYQLQPEMTAKSDVARYALLSVQGGLYADMDTECVRPATGMLEDSQATLFVQVYDSPWTPVRGRPPQYERICNAVMASVPAHPVWREVRPAIERNPMSLIVPARTGPMALQPLVKSHKERHLQDVWFWDHRWILTASHFPRLCMRGYGSMSRKVCVLDFNDSGRKELIRLLRRPHELMATIAREVRDKLSRHHQPSEPCQ